MKFNVDNTAPSKYADDMATKYQMGSPIAEYRVTFSSLDKIKIILGTITLIFISAFFIYSTSLVKGHSNNPLLFPIFIFVDIFSISGISFYYILWLLYQRQRYRLRSVMCLIVCEEGIIFVKGEVIDVAHWRQILNYSTLKLYFFKQITLRLSDGRTLYTRNIFDNFNNFIHLLKKHTRQ